VYKRSLVYWIQKNSHETSCLYLWKNSSLFECTRGLLCIEYKTNSTRLFVYIGLLQEVSRVLTIYTHFYFSYGDHSKMHALPYKLTRDLFTTRTYKRTRGLFATLTHMGEYFQNFCKICPVSFFWVTSLQKETCIHSQETYTYSNTLFRNSYQDMFLLIHLSDKTSPPEWLIHVCCMAHSHMWWASFTFVPCFLYIFVYMKGSRLTCMSHVAHLSESWMGHVTRT